MEHTRENVVKLLKAMSANAYAVAETFRDEDGNDRMYVAFINQSIGMQTAIDILSNPEMYQQMCEIYYRFKNCIC